MTYVDERGAAAMSGLQVHDKLLQVSGVVALDRLSVCFGWEGWE